MSKLFANCVSCALYDRGVGACRGLDPSAFRKSDLERPCAFYRTKEDYQKSCQEARMRQMKLFGTILTGPIGKARS